MPPLPPPELVLPVVGYDLLLPAAVAAASFGVAARLSPRPAVADLAAILGFALGFLLGNHFQDAATFRLDPETPLAATSWFEGLKATVVGVSDEGPPAPSARYWLTWAAGFAALVGWIVRTAGMAYPLAAIVRVATSVGTALLLTPPPLRKDSIWMWPALSAAIAVGWELLDRLGRTSPGGWLAGGVAGVFLCAGGVILHAHSARLTDFALLAAGAWIGLAIAGWLTQADVGAAAPFGAVVLPALLLSAHYETYSEVPAASFLLTGFALAALAPLLFVPTERLRTWRFAATGWSLLAGAALVGLILAMQAESLSFG